MIRTIAFWAAVAGYALLLVMVVAGGAAWPGYSHTTQFISELGATGAPHARLVNFGAFLPIGLLISLFAVLAMLIPPRGVLRTLGFLGIFVFATGYTGAAFFPCDAGCDPVRPDPSASQVLHFLFGTAGYIVAAPTLLALAIASRTWPGGRLLFPLGIVCAAVSGLALLGMIPPMEGLFQRVLEGAVGLWILACAFTLRRAPQARGSSGS